MLIYIEKNSSDTTRSLGLKMVAMVIIGFVLRGLVELMIGGVEGFGRGALLVRFTLHPGTKTFWH
ncbi:MAG: hypothetical protein WBB19_20305 [Desulforhopalus sp.]